MSEAIILSILCTSIFINFKHPLVLVGTLTFQTMPGFLILYFFSENMWVAYMLFLIFLGGLLVIFIYLAALIPNELFQMELIKILFMGVFMVVFFIMMKNTTMNTPMNNSEINLSMFSHTFIKSLFPLMLLYLVSGLFSVMLVCEKSKSPLKTNTYE